MCNIIGNKTFYFLKYGHVELNSVNFNPSGVIVSSDPGVINKKNLDRLKPMYENREQRHRLHLSLKLGNSKKPEISSNDYKQCTSCHLDRIKRSKHCKMCGVSFLCRIWSDFLKKDLKF